VLPLTNRVRLLILIVAYHAETTIEAVLSRIPAELSTNFDVEVLVIDDSSTDTTFETALRAKRAGNLFFETKVLFNPINQGYGGNQKIGYHYAIENKFDFVALIHGDGQYAPECLPELLAPLISGEAEAVFGSRMLSRGGALKGGMPLYKYAGNKILTWFENRVLGANLSEFHSGYRVYAVRALEKIPFESNTNDFHFDTEIIIQLVFAGMRIRELPIPTYYGDEICRVNGIKYAFDVARSVLLARVQQIGLCYNPKFDCVEKPNERYQLKLGYSSPHTETLRKITKGSRVLDLGCAGGYVGVLLKETLGCHVVGVDSVPLDKGNLLDRFVQHDLNLGLPDLDMANFDFILLLDVIEHLSKPEQFVRDLSIKIQMCANVTVIASTGNIGFLITRAMLLLGQFNYGKRGILDMTHCRLFTVNSFRRLHTQNGLSIDSVIGLPAPYPLALKLNRLSRCLVALNNFFIRLSKGLFSYQIYIVSRPTPTLARLLHDAKKRSEPPT
jgi:glycosyltransferase involved in cell wall biosynthesis